jgi:3-isopropylmalate/(R)-2-methylmalate dehydratase large subunit
MGKTLAEKIIGEHAGGEVKAGQIVLARVDVCLTQDGTGPLAVRQLEKLALERLANPDRTVLFLDHSVPASRKELADDHQTLRNFAAKTGAQLSEVGMGICHTVINEQYVNPGDILIGADSHTCTGGALCAFATGMGSTDVAIGMALGKTWLRVPETFKIVVKGEFPLGVFPKDLILHLIGMIGADGATYKALEWHGETIEKMDMEGRLTLSNMAVEAGAKAGLIPSDETTRRYLEQLGRGEKFREIKPDPDAEYERVIEIDASKLTPVVSFPHTVDNTRTIEEAKGERINQVFLGTCTNSRVGDWEVVANIVKGKKKHPEVRFIAVPGSVHIQREVMRRGYYQTLLDFGAMIMPPGCGPCVGVYGGILGSGEKCLSTMNRNFRGRMGNPEGFIYLGSPATVAATAIAGEIADPREYEAELKRVGKKITVPSPAIRKAVTKRAKKKVAKKKTAKKKAKKIVRKKAKKAAAKKVKKAVRKKVAKKKAAKKKVKRAVKKKVARKKTTKKKTPRRGVKKARKRARRG